METSFNNTQIKIFSNTSLIDIQDEVNDFLKKNANFTLLDIKFDQDTKYFYIIIIYKTYNEMHDLNK